MDRVWLVAAGRVGFKIVREPNAYASTDGRRTIILGTPETLDPDDCLAQMILHELCHALVEAPAGLGRRDWGLDNESDRDVPREHACLRLQAALLRPHGLRQVLAPTTDFRAFYDALPEDPLPPGSDDPTVVAARLGLIRSRRAPWHPNLGDALAATGEIARAVAGGFAGVGDGDDDGLASLWSVAEPPAPRHPNGLPMIGEGSCGTCAWRATIRGVDRCRQAENVRVEPGLPGCERWEPALDCQTCGACCRAAYDAVEVTLRDPMVKLHPDMLVRRDKYLEVRREGDRCAALSGGTAPGERYACTIYDGRPRTCREFTLGSAHCLDARQRVGLSR